MHAPAPTISMLIDKIRIVKDATDEESVLSALGPDNVDGPVRVAFVNAHAMNMCHTDPSFLSYLLACDYVFRDGAGMKILYKMLGRDPGLNMNGTDFIPKILDRYKGRDVALLGTDSPYLERAADKITARGLPPVLTMNGFQEAALYIDRLKETPAPLVVLAMGMPKQEYVAALIARDASAPSLIVCGGAILDFIGEKVVRAPEIFRKTGMEWLYRLAQEPSRLFGRYVIGNFVFMGRAVRLMRSAKSSKNKEGSLHILHVVRQYAPAIGGLESYVQSIAAHQKALGHDCEVLTLNRVFHGNGAVLPAEEIIDGVKVKRVGFWGRRRFFIPKVSPFYFKKFDVVHVHNTDVFYDYVALSALLTGIKPVATTHGGFFHTKDFSLVKQVYFNTVTRFSSFFYKAIFAISGNDLEMFKRLSSKVTLMPNAVEPLGKGITTGQDFLYIGRIAEHKRVDRIIEVFSRLKSDHNVPGKLHIVGPEWDVKIEPLQKLAQARSVESDVIFHGAASRERMAEIAMGCGYFLSASTFEGFGMSMIEAMSVGMIPFVEANESFRELVERSGVGLCGDYTETDAIAAQIAASLPAQAEERERAASFAAQFSWDDLSQNVISTYRQVE